MKDLENVAQKFLEETYGEIEVINIKYIDNYIYSSEFVCTFNVEFIKEKTLEMEPIEIRKVAKNAKAINGGAIIKHNNTYYHCEFAMPF